jgi:hypothetical protein
LFLAYFPYFEKTKLGLRDHHAVCVSVNPPFHKLLNARTNHETWYAQLNGVSHKFLPKACLSVCASAIVARQLLGKNVTAAMNTHAAIKNWTPRFICGSCRIKGL